MQLGLFTPHEEGYEFKVIVTNKRGKAKPILLFHKGRASQENQFSELKSQCNMDYVPTRRLSGTQLYFLSAVFAHNLYREFQMTVRNIRRPTTPKRAALWIFEEAASIRRKPIQRAGRLSRPLGQSITLASIVEKEAVNGRDYGMIAAVFANRLRANIPVCRLSFSNPIDRPSNFFGYLTKSSIEKFPRSKSNDNPTKDVASKLQRPTNPALKSVVEFVNLLYSMDI